MSPSWGTVGALGGKYHIRQEGGLENVIPSCKMGTISHTGCGEDDEVCRTATDICGFSP